MKPFGLQPHAWVMTRVLRFIAYRTVKWRFFHIRAYGQEHIPASGAAVVVSNHLSFSDPPILWATARRNIVMIAMKELWRSPAVFVMVLLGHIPIDRGNIASARKARKRMLDVVEAGGLLGGYPEGKISADGTQLPFKPGLFEVARTANVPVIPSGIAGSNGLLPLGKWLPNRQRRVVIVYGAPLYPGDYETRKDLIRASEWTVAACHSEALHRLTNSYV